MFALKLREKKKANIEIYEYCTTHEINVIKRFY